MKLLQVIAVALMSAYSGMAGANPVRVAAVNAPLADFAQRIAGDRAQIVYPVPEGADPAFWRPAVKDISAIQQADLILLNGADFAAWTSKASLPRSRTVNTSGAFADDYITTSGGVTHSHGADGEHSHKGLASLTWLDLSQAARQIQAIGQALARRDGAGAEAYRDGAGRLAQDLQVLHTRAAAAAEPFRGTPVLASHPGLEYFARAYGLTLTTLDWPAGDAPTAAQLSALDAQTDGVPTGALFLFLGDPHPEARDAILAKGMVPVVIDPATNARGQVLDILTANIDRLEAAGR